MALGRRPLMSRWRGSAGAPGSPWNVSIIRFPPLKRAPLLTPPKPPLPPPPAAPALDWPKNPSPEKAAACRGRGGGLVSVYGSTVVRMKSAAALPCRRRSWPSSC